MSLAKRIKNEREKIGLTQAELGEKANSTQQAIYKIEEGKTKNPRNLNEIAKALGVSESYLKYGAIEGVTYAVNYVLKDIKAESEKLEKFILPVDYFCFTVCDDSMTSITMNSQKSFSKGEIVAISSSKKYKNGSYVLAEHKTNKNKILRQLTTDGITQKLIPNNHMYSIYSADDFNISGVVVAKFDFNF